MGVARVRGRARTRIRGRVTARARPRVVASEREPLEQQHHQDGQQQRRPRHRPRRPTTRMCTALGQVRTASGQVRTASGQVLTPPPRAIFDIVIVAVALGIVFRAVLSLSVFFTMRLSNLSSRLLHDLILRHFGSRHRSARKAFGLRRQRCHGLLRWQQ